MKLIAYELKKILHNKVMPLLLLILLAANWVLATVDITEEDKINERDMSRFTAIYCENTEETFGYMTFYYNEVNRYIDKEVGAKIPDNIFSENDLMLFRNFSSVRTADKTYHDRINSAVYTVKSQLAEYEYLKMPDSSFEVAYATAVLRSYETLDDIEIPIANVVGYDRFYSYSGFCVFLMAALCIVAILLVIPEKNTGMLSVLRCTKNGRAKTFFAKAGAGIIISWVLTVLFAGTTLLAYLFKIGLEGFYLPIQILDSMILCPFRITIGQGIFIILAARLFSASAFFLFVFAVSVCFGDYLPSFAACAGFIALNYLAGVFRFSDLYHPIKSLNFFSSLSGTSLISAWRGIRVFGRCVPLAPALLITYFLLGAGLLTLGSFAFSKTKAGFSFHIGKRPEHIHKEAKRKVRRYPASLSFYEWHKLFTPVSAVLLAVAACVSLFWFNRSFHWERNYYETITYTYMKKLEGPWTEEKHNSLLEEEAELSEILSHKETVQYRYDTGLITLSSYGEYMGKCASAESKLPVLSQVIEHSYYLKDLTEQGINVAFTDETGWTALNNFNAGAIVCALLVLLFSDTYSMEYRSGFSDILRTAKKGRTQTALSKLFLATCITLLIAAVYEGLSFLYAARSFGLPGAEYAACSIELFEGETETVLSLFLTRALYHLAFYLLITYAAVLLSRFTKRIFATLSIMAVLLYAPTVFSYFGIAFFDKINILSLFGRGLWN